MIWLEIIAGYFFCAGLTAYLGEWAGWDSETLPVVCALAPISVWAALGAWVGRMAGDAAGVHRNRLGRQEKLEQAKFELEMLEIEGQKKDYKELR